MIDINQLLKTNHFSRRSQPLILVLRETTDELGYEEDTGDNNCDSILLISRHGSDCKIDHWLKGRSLPHKKYQEKMVKGTARANYIASGYYMNAWRKGLHRGHEALVQNRSFVIFRSLDMQLKDDDDYPEYHTIVADNFHGWAPFSAGCVTVVGSMQNKTDDWGIAHKWLYSEYSDITFFDCCILEHDDAVYYDESDYTSLRVGSVGPYVHALQNKLGIKPDGDFGPMTHEALLKDQASKEMTPTGVYYVEGLK